jgi:hypothetical protein
MGKRYGLGSKGRVKRWSGSGLMYLVSSIFSDFVMENRRRGW